MLRIGFNIEEKKDLIRKYCQENNVDKIYIFSPERFYLKEFEEEIEYKDIIRYKYFYRLLREISSNDLIVVNECLRSQNRSDLTYNCMRQYLNQTNHKIIFQYLPQIDTFDDFMILLDFENRSKFKMQKFEDKMIEGVDIEIKEKHLNINVEMVEVSVSTKIKYQKLRDKYFKDIGNKDPHTIPRNLHLIGGKERIVRVIDKPILSRNNRFKSANVETYKTCNDLGRFIIDFPHRFSDMADYLYLSDSQNIDVVCSDLKVDIWYLDKFTNWTKRIKNAYSKLQ